jgi:hypothetical protein
MGPSERLLGFGPYCSAGKRSEPFFKYRTALWSRDLLYSARISQGTRNAKKRALSIRRFGLKTKGCKPKKMPLRSLFARKRDLRNMHVGNIFHIINPASLHTLLCASSSSSSKSTASYPVVIPPPPYNTYRLSTSSPPPTLAPGQPSSSHHHDHRLAAARSFFHTGNKQCHHATAVDVVHHL